MGVDIRLDAFRAFFAVVQAADGGRLAPALDAVGAADRTSTRVWVFMVATDSLCGRMVGTSTRMVSMFADHI
jgi:hypothetical protein